MALNIAYSRLNGLSEFKTNTWTLTDQFAPDVLGLSNGGFVSAYNNFNVDGGGILLSFRDATFNPVGDYRFAFDGDTRPSGSRR